MTAIIESRTEIVTPELRLPDIRELEAGDVLTNFERQWFGGLHLIPEGWSSNLKPRGPDFNALVRARFTPAFFEVDPNYAERAISYAVLKDFPERVPEGIFNGADQAIKSFCLDVIPIVEDNYPQTIAENPEFIASRIIVANVDAYGTVRDHFGLVPLTNRARIGLQLEIGEALADKEKEAIDGPVLLTKRPIELGINPRYSP